MEAFVTLKKRPKFPLYRTFLKFCTKHLNYANVKKASLNKSKEKERKKLSFFFVDLLYFLFTKIFFDLSLLSEDDNEEENYSESASNADSTYYNMPAVVGPKLSWLDSAKIRYGIKIIIFLETELVILVI